MDIIQKTDHGMPKFRLNLNFKEYEKKNIQNRMHNHY